MAFLIYPPIQASLPYHQRKTTAGQNSRLNLWNSGIDYSEGLFIDYHWPDHKNIGLLYPFGHGLSYTTLSSRSFLSCILDSPSGQVSPSRSSVVSRKSSLSPEAQELSRSA
ncbi:hypothetical protein BC938DRAFT_473484 [Jimgerdemannia flammicorona]|uniref:Glycoside hydrolase family 3 C-terminal domain-containing protein n=1 Tax=Jimgerdemannia flammicorona TaxID=994334 RepID=A0A433QTE3_9FUNG|nr:hypothetical protein BC938DRAFT_473484 [Jimgerdemannia flammicorona]